MIIRRLWILALLVCVLGMQNADAYIKGSVNILGMEYTEYEVGKGESLYGIAKTMNWDVDQICALNPGIEANIKEGTVIYYPVATTPSPHGEDTISYEVSRSETVYSIAKQFNLTPEDIYAANPQSQYGIKAGEKLIVPIGKQAKSGQSITHIVKQGETLYGLAKQYNTRVEDIMRNNPGVSEKNFQIGAKIKIIPGSRNQNLIKEKVTESKLLSITNYKVKKNDTWAKIAASQKVDEAILKAANPSISELEKDINLIVPHTEAVAVEKMVPEVDPRESTPEGREEIFQEVQEEIARQAAANQKVLVLLDEYETNKDMEFTRGLIAAVDELKDSPFHISLKVVDGRESETSVLKQIDSFEPTLIIVNTEKDIPLYVADYAALAKCYVANMFNVKSELYTTNPYMIQMLTPSEYFNSEIAETLGNKYGNRTLVIAGEPGTNDTMLENLFKYFEPRNVISVSENDIDNYEADPTKDYLIYGTATKKADVKALIEKIARLKEKSPASEIATLGKANWITHADALKEQYCEAEVMVPSRSYFDSELAASKDFIDNYKDLYEHTPMKSFPVYSVAGYDALRFLLEALYTNPDNPEAFSTNDQIEALQNDIKLRRVSAEGGLYNPIVYLVKFNTFGNIDKIRVE